MKTNLLAAVSVVALTSGIVHAADIPMPTKAPIMAAPVFSWTGCYAGVHAGWGWARQNITETNTSFTGLTFSNGIDANGGLGGGQVGCNYQFSPNWVVGIQGDFAAADLHGSTIEGLFLGPPNTFDMKVESIASVTGRIGATAWNNRALLYVKGGGAWAQTHWDLSNLGTPFAAFSTVNETRTGWTVGGGIEWAFLPSSPNWSAFAEFDHYDFGNKTFASGNTVGNFCSFGAGPLVHCFQTLSSSLRIETVKVGVNYRFY